MAGFTNKGKYRLLETLRGVSLPSNMYVALCTSAAAPTQDTNTLSEMTQIGTSTGYTSGGISLNMDTTDWSIVEDDTNDDAELTIKDLVWTGSGGTLGAARYAVLTDDNGTEADREIWAYWDLGSDQSVSSGQTLTLSGFILKLAE
mgnify:FL=1|tara:strand:- start:3374 stop:3811 length:438 start_codon:yes stop_codon:yes gene_type:complete